MDRDTMELGKFIDWAENVGATLLSNVETYDYKRYSVTNNAGATFVVEAKGSVPRSANATKIAAGTAEVYLDVNLDNITEQIRGFLPINPDRSIDFAFGEEDETMYEAAGVVRVDIGSPAAADEDGSDLGEVASASDGVTAVDVSNITQPDVPRNVSINPCDLGTVADIAAGDITITGTDANGDTITEALTMSANQAHDSTTDGAKAFASITGISIPSQDGADATFYIGYEDVLGLPYARETLPCIAAYLNATIEGTAPTIAADASNLESNTINLNSALDGNTVVAYLVV